MYVIYEQIIVIRVADHKKKEHSQKHAKKSPFFSPNYHYLLFLLLFLLLLLLSFSFSSSVYSLTLVSVTVCARACVCMHLCVAMPMGIKIETISNETGRMEYAKKKRVNKKLNLVRVWWLNFQSFSRWVCVCVFFYMRVRSDGKNLSRKGPTFFVRIFFPDSLI